MASVEELKDQLKELHEQLASINELLVEDPENAED
jgi:hypothetical protein